jgi:hypothetical protein
MSNPSRIFIHCLRICCLGWAIVLPAVAFAGDGFHAGPIFDQFSLTLDSGRRTEAVGPFFYNQEADTEKTWAIPPLLSYAADPAAESKEFDLLYPVLNYESYGREFRWQFCQLLSFAGGQSPKADPAQKRFTLFPFYFQQRSPVPDENYTALLPLYGHLQNRLFRDEIFFVLFPLYGETRRRDVVTDNYLWPFFHLRHGDGLSGWQAWPLAGKEHKDVTTHTNGFNETEIMGGHDKFFALWPFYFDETTGIGTDNPETWHASLLIYAQLRSPQRDYTSVIWPFFAWIDDRGGKYREWELPWPIVIVARGDGKTITRVFPLFSQAHDGEQESDFYLWPIYRYNHFHAGVFDRERTRILFYLFGNLTEKNTDTGGVRHRVALWPLFTWQRDFNDKERLQILALIEPVLPNNRGVERNWSPLWSLWRSEGNPKAGAASQSLLWNFYRYDTTPTAKKCSLLLGLFQYQSDSGYKRLRLLHVPVFKWHRQMSQPAK